MTSEPTAIPRGAAAGDRVLSRQAEPARSGAAQALDPACPSSFRPVAQQFGNADVTRANVMFLTAVPGAGAECLLNGLKASGRFRCVRVPGLFDAGVGPLLNLHTAPPRFGLHWLSSLSGLAVATRRLLDEIIGALAGQGRKSNAGEAQPIIVYSPESCFHLQQIRMLYPDAVIIQLRRSIFEVLSDFELRVARAGTSAYRICSTWRSAEHAALGASPWPGQVSLRYEDLISDPPAAAAVLSGLARVELTGDQNAAFCRAFIGPSRGKSAQSHRAQARLVRWSAAVYCQAELADLGYRESTGLPGLTQRLLASVILKIIHGTLT